ncbi:MAG TPA: 16S rRNA (guanine(966)-N(2))-methyltransferase RsmD [Bryobacteraceae bacterium]|nr:16S rRNA (guanine(966)-N(2))-methyltransferase RsmD [Bryobacteraceae bacterium]
MRVIGGEFRSRVLKTVPGLDVRPTPDRLRETLFNILTPRLRGKVFLDAYAGTGSVGIEALSRGAPRAIFIEKNRKAVDILRENLAALGLQDRSKVIFGKVSQNLTSLNADVCFIDPPYPLALEYEMAMTALAQTAAQLVIAQHSTRAPLSASYGGLLQFRTLRQGENTLSFYQPALSDND